MPQDAKLVERIGDIYWRFKHDPVKALLLYEQAIAARPHDVNLFVKVCRFLELSDKTEQAIVEYGKLLKESLPPEMKKEFLISRASLLLKLNRKNEAIDSIRIGFEPTSSFDYAILAGFYEDAGLVTEAEVTFFRGNKLSVKDDDIARNRLYLANHALRRKAYDRAEELGRALMEDFKTNLPVFNKGARIVSLAQRERFNTTREKK